MKKIDSAAPVKPNVQVIERMFALMDVLASREDALSLKEISEKTGLHPSTTHRILNDLATGRFVERPEAGTYRLGMRLLELGNMVKARLSVRDAALGPMRELHKLTQQPVNLSMRQGDEIIYVERAYSERSGMQVVRAIGGRAPLHLTSTGKLFLAGHMPHVPASGVTRATALHNCLLWNASWPRHGNTVLPATMKNWNWECAASRPACMTTRADWWQGCLFPRLPTGSMKAGCPNCSQPSKKFRWP